MEAPLTGLAQLTPSSCATGPRNSAEEVMFKAGWETIGKGRLWLDCGDSIVEQAVKRREEMRSRSWRAGNWEHRELGTGNWELEPGSA